MVPELINERLTMLPTCSVSRTSLSGCSEICSRSMTMIGGGGGRPTELRVVVKVYRTSLEHFAVLYPEKVICKPIGFINLKNCTVECVRNAPRTLQIVQNSCDGGVLTFRADSNVDMKLWTDVLQSNNKKTISRKRMDVFLNVALPILEEGEDDE